MLGPGVPALGCHLVARSEKSQISEEKRGKSEGRWVMCIDQFSKVFREEDEGVFLQSDAGFPWKGNVQQRLAFSCLWRVCCALFFLMENSHPVCVSNAMEKENGTS